MISTRDAGSQNHADSFSGSLSEFRQSISLWSEAIRSGNRAALGQAITLIESQKKAHRSEALELLYELSRGHRPTSPSLRVGVSGSVGSGKSTMIEALGRQWLEEGWSVGVLSVDPSSTISGGSVLGDKTRMPQLARQLGAFVRPSPTGGWLGGVTRHTREVILVLEYAGYERIILETVGVGQSESQCADMVDLLCVLQLAGTGDEIQAMKKGLHELADILCISKADDPKSPQIIEAVSIWRAAASAPPAGWLRWQYGGNEEKTSDSSGPGSCYRREVLALSSQRDDDVTQLKELLAQKFQRLLAEGAFTHRRAAQQRQWYEDECQYLIKEALNEQAQKDRACIGQAQNMEALGLEEDSDGIILPPLAAARFCRPLIESIGRRKP